VQPFPNQLLVVKLNFKLIPLGPELFDLRYEQLFAQLRFTLQLGQQLVQFSYLLFISLLLMN
jgi:hypothetical protein